MTQHFCVFTSIYKEIIHYFLNIKKQNKMKKHVIYSMIVICGLTTSCTYYPRLTGIPLIKEKGDTRIEGGVGVFSQSAQVSVAHGATENIAFHLAASIDPYGPQGSSGLYTQGAIGYYKNFQDRRVMEMYGGLALGRSEAHNAERGTVFGNYQMYFAQFNIGNIEQKKANMEYGFGLKSGILSSKMTDAEYFGYDYPQNKPYPVYRLNGIVAEPTFFLRFGGEKLKFFTSLGYSLYYQMNNTDQWLPASAPNFGLGISYSFGGNTNSKYFQK